MSFSVDDLRSIIIEEHSKLREQWNNDLQYVTTKIAACESRIEDLETRVTLCEQGNNNETNLSTCFVEWEDRLKRRNNLIIFGMTDIDPAVNVNVHNSDLAVVY